MTDVDDSLILESAPDLKKKKGPGWPVWAAIAAAVALAVTGGIFTYRAVTSRSSEKSEMAEYGDGTYADIPSLADAIQGEVKDALVQGASSDAYVPETEETSEETYVETAVDGDGIAADTGAPAETGAMESAYGAESGIPEMTELFDYSDERLTELAGAVDVYTLTEYWGEPVSSGSYLLWQTEIDGKTRFIAVTEENGRILNIMPSKTLYLTCIDLSDSGYGLCCTVSWDGYTDDFSMLCRMPERTVAGETVDASNGDLIELQFGGMIQETLPGNIPDVFSINKTGTLSESDLKALEEKAAEWLP